MPEAYAAMHYGLLGAQQLRRTLMLQDSSLSHLSAQETVEHFVAAYNAATQGGALGACKQCLDLLHAAAKDQVLAGMQC